MAARKSLSQWIRETMVGIEGDTAKCVAFTLFHCPGNQKIEMKSIKLGGKAWDPMDLGQMFDNIAATFASGIPGMQQFLLEASFDDAMKAPESYPFRKDGEDSSFGLSSEPPTEKGLMAQLMRMHEGVLRTVLVHSGNLHERSQMMNDRLAEENEQLRKEQHETIELAKALITKAAEDQHKHKMELLAEQRKINDRETVKRLAPAFVNRLLGKEIVPQSAADSSMLDFLADDMSEDQIVKMVGILTPAQAAVVVPRLKEALDRKEKLKEEKAKTAAE